VNDHIEDYWGKVDIAEWAARDIIGARLTMYVVKVLEHYGHVDVTAYVDGRYDKRGLPCPLVLTFHFSAAGGRNRATHHPAESVRHLRRVAQSPSGPAPTANDTVSHLQ
jgi:hypothetical protein